MKRLSKWNPMKKRLSFSFLKSAGSICQKLIYGVVAIYALSALAVIFTQPAGKERTNVVVIESLKIITQRNMLGWPLYVYCSRRSVASIAKAFSMLTVIVAILYAMRIWIRNNVVVLNVQNGLGFLSWIYPSKKSENDGSNSSIATLFDHTYWSVFIKMRQIIFWYNSKRNLW